MRAYQPPTRLSASRYAVVGLRTHLSKRKIGRTLRCAASRVARRLFPQYDVLFSIQRPLAARPISRRHIERAVAKAKAVTVTDCCCPVRRGHILNAIHIASANCTRPIIDDVSVIYPTVPDPRSCVAPSWQRRIPKPDFDCLADTMRGIYGLAHLDAMVPVRCVCGPGNVASPVRDMAIEVTPCSRHSDMSRAKRAASMQTKVSCFAHVTVGAHQLCLHFE